MRCTMTRLKCHCYVHNDTRDLKEKELLDDAFKIISIILIFKLQPTNSGEGRAATASRARRSSCWCRTMSDAMRAVGTALRVPAIARRARRHEDADDEASDRREEIQQPPDSTETADDGPVAALLAAARASREQLERRRFRASPPTERRELTRLKAP